MSLLDSAHPTVPSVQSSSKVMGLRMDLAQQLAQSVLSMMARDENDGARLESASQLCDFADDVTRCVESLRELVHKRSPAYGALMSSSPQESTGSEAELSMRGKLVGSVQQLLQGVCIAAGAVEVS